jgi:hypothetical protein
VFVRPDSFHQFLIPACHPIERMDSKIVLEEKTKAFNENSKTVKKSDFHSKIQFLSFVK